MAETKQVQVSFNVDQASQALIDMLRTVDASGVIAQMFAQGVTKAVSGTGGTPSSLGGGVAPAGGVAGSAPAPATQGSIQNSQPAAASTVGAAPVPPPFSGPAPFALRDKLSPFEGPTRSVDLRPGEQEGMQQALFRSFAEQSHVRSLDIPAPLAAPGKWDSFLRDDRNEHGRRMAAQAAAYTARGLGTAASLLSPNPSPEAPFIQGAGGVLQQYGIASGNRGAAAAGAAVQIVGAVDQATSGLLMSMGNQYAGLERPYARMAHFGMGSAGLGGSIDKTLGQPDYLKYGKTEAERAYAASEFVGSMGRRVAPEDFSKLGEMNPFSLEARGIGPGVGAFYMASSAAGGASSGGLQGTADSGNALLKLSENMGLVGGKQTEFLSRAASALEGMASRGIKIDPQADAAFVGRIASAALAGAGGNPDRAIVYGTAAMANVTGFQAQGADMARSGVDLKGLERSALSLSATEWNRAHGLKNTEWEHTRTMQQIAGSRERLFEAVVERFAPGKKGGSEDLMKRMFVASGLATSNEGADQLAAGWRKQQAAGTLDISGLLGGERKDKIASTGGFDITAQKAVLENETVTQLSLLKDELHTLNTNLQRGQSRGLTAAGWLTWGTSAGDGGAVEAGDTGWLSQMGVK